MILARVIIEICAYVVITVNDLYILSSYFHRNFTSFCLIIVYNLMFLSHSVLCIIEGMYRSDTFKELLDSFNKILMKNRIDKDMSFNKSMKNLNLKCILASIVYLILTTVDIIHERLNYKFLRRYIILDILLHYVRIFREYRYLMEYLVYSFYMIILHKIFKRFNLMLEVTQQKLMDKIKEDENISAQIDLKIIERWAEMYGDILKISRAFTKCFGTQIIIATDVGIIYYIINLYYIWNILLNGDIAIQDVHRVTVLFNLVFSIVYYMFAIMIAIVAAQRVQNENRVLRIYLARLYYTLSAYPNLPELKKIRNFCRMVSKNPVEINIVPEMGIGMPLLPTCVSLSATYVITMLQLNHAV